MSRFLIPLALLLTTGLSSCISSADRLAQPNAPAGPLEVRQVTDLDARGTDGHFTFFSLRDGRIVPPEDSASTAWDLALRSTTILVNSGASGPGAGGIAVLPDTTLEAVTMAPPDAEFATDRGAQRGQTALPTGAGQGWYDYDMSTGVVEPKPLVLVVRTADGRFAKMRIKSYYLGAPAGDDLDPRGGFRYYTFEYVFQPDGSRHLR